MGKILITLSEKLEEKLRKVVQEDYAGRHGAISIIAEKAIEKYLEGQE